MAPRNVGDCPASCALVPLLPRKLRSLVGVVDYQDRSSSLVAHLLQNRNQRGCDGVVGFAVARKKATVCVDHNKARTLFFDPLHCLPKVCRSGQVIRIHRAIPSTIEAMEVDAIHILHDLIESAGAVPLLKELADAVDPMPEHIQGVFKGDICDITLGNLIHAKEVEQVAA